MNDLFRGKYKNNREKSILEFSLSQKKILYNHVKLFNNRIIKEFQTDIFDNLKKNYV